MNISNFRGLHKEAGVMTAYVDIGNSQHKRKLAIVKKDGDCWKFIHDGCSLKDEHNHYCNTESAKIK